MARRLTLSELADRVADSVRKGLSPDDVPKATQRLIGRLESALGLDRPLHTYSERTRSRYLSAAKSGRTAKQQREHEKAQRHLREEQKAGRGLTRDPRWREVTELRDKAVEMGLVLRKGPDTDTDEIDSPDLLTDDALQDHIKVYGYDYVLRHMRPQIEAAEEYRSSAGSQRKIGRTRMNRHFAASPSVKDRDDERWFWYHTSGYQYGDLKGMAKYFTGS